MFLFVNGNLFIQNLELIMYALHYNAAFSTDNLSHYLSLSHFHFLV